MTRIQSRTARLVAFSALAFVASAAVAETAPPTPAIAAVTTGTTLTLTIEGVRSDKGKIYASLIKADAAASVARKAGGARGTPIVGTTTLTFEGLAPGDYAVQLFHDENDNGTMDSNLFGIPSEGYAFSNRARASFGPPKFADMKFTVTAAPATTAAVMNY
jgi:uncharacterized protein (DUF2141 family)